HHRSLHSFPTRRSSDLLRTLSVFQSKQAMYEIGSVLVEDVDCLAFQRAGIGSVKWCWDCFYVLPVNRFRSDLMKTCDHLNVFVKDRKSTRLNSSHVSIS